MTKVKKVLVLGSGGREHVFIWKLSADLSPDQLFVAPGNAGMTHLATQVNLGVLEFEKIAQFCLQNHIEIILPGGEDSLVAGIVDYFQSIPELQHIYVFGPSKEAAQLEGSKTYCKAFMQKYGIPTAAYQSFTSAEIEDALKFLKTLNPPYVLKADGLAAGKGVLILPDYETAVKELELMLLHSKFGAAGNRVVIEEFMDGIEFSVFVMTDNEGYIILPEAKDYKRVGDGDTGLNTGGMGAVSPVPFVDEQLRKKVIQTIIEPTMRGLKEENLEYRGFIFFGLININGTPKVIEYNVRMGDPETEVVLPRLNNSLYDVLLACSSGTLNQIKADVNADYCTTVFCVSGGYPESFPKGKIINITPDSSSLFFHAGTSRNEKGALITSGGRVIAVSHMHRDLKSCIEANYQSLKNVSYEGLYHRSDIGNDLFKILNA